MSRYLDYSDPTVQRNEVYRIKDPPEARGPLLIRGPEDRFKTYLTKDYRGGSTVCCGGRFAVGQVWPNSISTITMTLLPGTYYFTCILPNALSPPAKVLDSFLGVSQSILAIVILVSFALVSSINPGIVPRNKTIPPELDGHLDVHGQPNYRFLLINGITVKQKFCMTCKIFRPPRSKHCTYCDNCILRFDHHCTWLGNCVGLHNYRYFVALIWSATVFVAGCIYATFCIFSRTMRERFGPQADFVDWAITVWEEPRLVAFLIYCFFLMVAVLLLSIYHTVISLQNLTTNEHVKNYYKDNPFDFGGPKNCLQIYCHPERVLAQGDDQIEADYVPFGSYSDGFSFDEV